MAWLGNVWDFIAQTLLGELLVVIAGIFISRLLDITWNRWRYGGWTVHILRQGEEILREEIPPAKAKEILDDPISLRIYIKGLVSGYEWIHGDLLTDGRQSGLFMEDRAARRFTIDLDKNPETQTANRKSQIVNRKS